MRLTKAQLARKGLRRKDVEIPDTSGGTVSIQELPADVTREFRARLRDLDPKDESGQFAIAAEIVAAGTTEEDGRPMFQADEAAGLPSLLGEVTLVFLASEISRFSGMTGTAAEHADLEKKDAGA